MRAPSGNSVFWDESTAPFDVTFSSRRSARPLQEAEPVRASFFEVDGQVFQAPLDYSDLELPFYDVSDSDDPERTVHEMASSIQHTPLPLTGRLVKFALFQTRLDEFYLFGLRHHISVDGMGMALVSPSNCHDLLGIGGR